MNLQSCSVSDPMTLKVKQPSVHRDIWQQRMYKVTQNASQLRKTISPRGPISRHFITRWDKLEISIHRMTNGQMKLLRTIVWCKMKSKRSFIVYYASNSRRSTIGFCNKVLLLHRVMFPYFCRWRANLLLSLPQWHTYYVLQDPPVVESKIKQQISFFFSLEMKVD